MHNNILFISGSFPNVPDGIGDSAKILFDNLIINSSDDKFYLLTTKNDSIIEFIKEKGYENCYYLDDWKLKLKNIKKIKRILKDNPDINIIHFEYPGNCYGRHFMASFLPLVVKNYCFWHKRKIKIHVRLHEFSQARFLRKIAILPILYKSDRIYIPSSTDRNSVKKIISKKKILKTYIGSNIFVDGLYEKDNNDRFVVSYFGLVYKGKGIERLLNLWKILKEKYGDRIYFKIIGEINPDNMNKFSEYHKDILSLIENYGLKNSIEITGYLKDVEVSHEITNSDLSMLLFEDGLTFRRGSFLAYLSHGVPIVTVQGDEDVRHTFNDCSGVFMCNSDEEIINKVEICMNADEDYRSRMRNDNINASKMFDWSNIAKDFLDSYDRIK